MHRSHEVSRSEARSPSASEKTTACPSSAITNAGRLTDTHTTDPLPPWGLDPMVKPAPHPARRSHTTPQPSPSPLTRLPSDVHRLRLTTSTWRIPMPTVSSHLSLHPRPKAGVTRIPRVQDRLQPCRRFEATTRRSARAMNMVFSLAESLSDATHPNHSIPGGSPRAAPSALHCPQPMGHTIPHIRPHPDPQPPASTTAPTGSFLSDPPLFGSAHKQAKQKAPPGTLPCGGANTPLVRILMAPPAEDSRNSGPTQAH